MTKQNNDQIILRKRFEEQYADLSNEMTEQEYFEIYSASEILKDYDLTYDDIDYGIVGGGGDGGIDAIYTILNGEPIKEDISINTNQKKNSIELTIIQSKTSAKFTEDTMLKFRESAEELFNLSYDLSDFKKKYNQELLDRVGLFRNAYEKLGAYFPELAINYYYVTPGNANEIHHNVSGKVERLEEDIKSLFSSAIFKFSFIGSKELLEMSRNVPSTSRKLEFTESTIGTKSGSYVCLVTLSNYYKFISDNGYLSRSIFESNVRDYQGSVVVNTAIRNTLSDKDSDNFWYLNNGVTVITPRATQSGKQLTIEDPQIVNGLQTSHEIYQYFSKLDEPNGDERAILVRVICEQDENARDRIINATNSQTNIPPASLRSADEVHKNIEDFLKANGFYYDRKKNFYKNQGMPVAKIISIPYMAQAMMAVTLLKPDSARARPSTLLNSVKEYEKIFHLATPIDVYLKVIQIMKAVETYLKPGSGKVDLERKDITNIKFYVAMLVGIKLADGPDDIVSSLASLPKVEMSDDLLNETTESTLKEYAFLGGTDRIAKGPDLRKALLSRSEN